MRADFPARRRSATARAPRGTPRAALLRRGRNRRAASPASQTRGAIPRDKRSRFFRSWPETGQTLFSRTWRTVLAVADEAQERDRRGVSYQFGKDTACFLYPTPH